MVGGAPIVGSRLLGRNRYFCKPSVVRGPDAAAIVPRNCQMRMSQLKGLRVAERKG